ncbi:MAG: hypothetical protein ISP91_06280 [Pseudomonadales bacterium]|nr:hypothetical protein [Pseudomonadales bacterium]
MRCISFNTLSEGPFTFLAGAFFALATAVFALGAAAFFTGDFFAAGFFFAAKNSLLTVPREYGWLMPG